MKDHIQKLHSIGACKEACLFANKHNTWQEVWDNNPHGDWSMWILGKKSGEVDSPKRLKLVGIAAECAELVLPIYEKRHPKCKRVRECIDTVKRYAQGKATLEEVKEARKNAAAAYDAAYADADAYAAYAAYAAATYAAYASAAYVAADAADAAYAAAYAAAAYADADAAYVAAADAYDAADAAGAAYADARTAMRKQCADIVRKYYPIAPTL